MGAALGITGRCGRPRVAMVAPSRRGAPGTLTRMTTETTMTRIQLGAMGEPLAVDHLTRMGLRILHRNWRCRYGELDLIAVDPATDTVVFVEVKTRTGDGFGGLAQAVHRAEGPPAASAGRALAGRARTSAGRRCAST